MANARFKIWNSCGGLLISKILRLCLTCVLDNPQYPSGEASNRLGGFQGQACVLYSRVVTWVAYLHSVSGQQLQCILIDGDNESMLAAQITQRC